MANLESKLISDNTRLWNTWKPMPQAQGIADRLRSGKLVRFIGPCALQSEEQALAIAEVIAPYSDGIRLPDKKPRTRPVTKDGRDLFFGIGHDRAIPIYQAVTERYQHLAIGAETMSGADIRRLAATGLLGFAWSGSRTQEQESLQGLGRAAQTTNTLMMVKNPLAPDAEMFLGMLENGIIGARNKIPFMVCIRGEVPVLTSDKELWRNRPNFELLDSLVESFPDLPVIVDVSHMVKAPKDELSEAKRLRTVGDLLQEAVNRGARGYLVEVHHPDHRSMTDPGENVYNLMNLLGKRCLIAA